MNWTPVAATDPKPNPKVPPSRSLPRRGSVKRQLYDWIERAGISGLTDEELSYKTGRPNEQVAAVREKLEEAELIEDSGHTRVGQQGEFLTAWRVTK